MSDKRDDVRGVSNQRLECHVLLFFFYLWQHRVEDQQSLANDCYLLKINKMIKIK